MNEYPKAIATVIVGALLFFARQYFPELVTSDFEVAIYTAVFSFVMLLFGRYTRMSATDAKELDKIKNPY